MDEEDKLGERIVMSGQYREKKDKGVTKRDTLGDLGTLILTPNEAIPTERVQRT